MKNFKLYSILESLEGIPNVTEYDTIDDYKIFIIPYVNNQAYIIYDEEFKVYRTIIYEGTDIDVKKHLTAYINFYKNLSDEEKNTLKGNINRKGYI